MNNIFLKIFLTLLILLLYYYVKFIHLLVRKYKLKYVNHFNVYNENDFGTILGFSISNNKNYHATFINSLCKVSRYKTLLVLFTNTIYNKNKLSCNNSCKYTNIKFIYIKKEYPYYPYNNEIYPINKKYLLLNIPNLTINSHFWNIMRFYLLKVWLEKYGNYKSEYLLCDIRDILFQCDPFQWDYRKGLYIGEECDDEIRKSVYNYKWVSIYTNSSSILNKRILNSGVIYGDYISIKIFLNELLLFMLNNHPENVDQGAVIYLIYTHNKWKIPISIFTSGFGPFRSISRIIDKVKIINLTLYNDDDTLPCIVHQFDRGINRNKIFAKMIKKWS